MYLKVDQRREKENNICSAVFDVRLKSLYVKIDWFYVFLSHHGVTVMAQRELINESVVHEGEIGVLEVQSKIYPLQVIEEVKVVNF